MTTGIVFGLQHFSVRDGPGIRSNVFLKGCPLRCRWCHNPEGLATSIGIQYRERKCAHCGACGGAFADMAAANDADEQRKCELTRRCRYGALELVGKRMSVDEVLADVEKDRRYFEPSGGGITISGGEPLLQADFARELAARAKGDKISVAIETSAYAPRASLEAIAPHVDWFLIDYKATSEERHRELVGVSNRLILENIEYLYGCGAQIILRCPLIPGVNDSEEHLRGIAQMHKKYPDLAGIEVMPYHKMGVSKASRVGLTQEEFRVPDRAQKDAWQAAIEGYGGLLTKMN